MKDDEKAGVKSFAVRLGGRIRPVLSLFALTIFATLAWAGYLNGQGTPYYVVSVFGSSALCLWHIWSFDSKDPQSCWEVFVVRLLTWLHASDLILRCLPGSSLCRGAGL